MPQHRRMMSGLIMHHATTQRRATMSHIPRTSGTFESRAATMRESGDLIPRRAATNLTPAIRLRVQPVLTALTERFRGGDDRNIVPMHRCPLSPAITVQE
jgi:hypothetical protein